MSDITRTAGRTQAERRADRQDRIDGRADRLRGEASAQLRRAGQISERFAGGQPILVGHHSERGARRDHARMDTAMRKGVALSREAAAVASVTPSTAVLATDSDGPEIMQARIEKALTLQARMKAANVAARKGDRVALAAQGFDPPQIEELLTPQWGNGRGPIGFPSYALSNNSANIRRMRERLVELRRAQTMTPTERTVGDVRVVEDPETMRIRLHFPGKPTPAVIATLKSNGFRWAPSERAWQRQLTPAGRMGADLVLGFIKLSGG